MVLFLRVYTGNVPYTYECGGNSYYRVISVYSIDARGRTIGQPRDNLSRGKRIIYIGVIFLAPSRRNFIQVECLKMCTIIKSVYYYKTTYWFLLFSCNYPWDYYCCSGEKDEKHIMYLHNMYRHTYNITRCAASRRIQLVLPALDDDNNNNNEYLWDPYPIVYVCPAKHYI